MPTELKLCQPEEIVIIQVGGERVFSENRLERKIQSDQRKERSKKRKASREKRARKLERTLKKSGIRQEEREREQREGISKKASF